jgi:hypothetical protein
VHMIDFENDKVIGRLPSSVSSRSPEANGGSPADWPSSLSRSRTRPVSYSFIISPALKTATMSSKAAWSSVLRGRAYACGCSRSTHSCVGPYENDCKLCDGTWPAKLLRAATLSRRKRDEVCGLSLMGIFFFGKCRSLAPYAWLKILEIIRRLYRSGFSDELG